MHPKPSLAALILFPEFCPLVFRLSCYCESLSIKDFNMRNTIVVALAGFAALSACAGGEEQASTAEETEVVDSSADEGSAAVLDANGATAEQLAAIDGITSELASAIVAGQPYASATAYNNKLLETLSAEDGAAIREKVFVPVNLNDASEADIWLIPGMTDKMVHEFLEYRPYEDLAEFDREIGKYVDEAEVARFRNYVTL